MDVIDRYCKGSGIGKQSTECKHLDDDKRTCQLLFHYETKRLWEECRHPPTDIIDKAKTKYLWLIVPNERESIQREQGIWFELECRLKAAELEKAFTLIHWIAYIKRSVRNQIYQIKYDNSIVHVPKGTYCRYCIYCERRIHLYCKHQNHFITKRYNACDHFVEKQNDK